ncbi:hypothetical protein [Pseudoalteromonas sp. T1lg21]|uniref:hypothetical protein n=1 Tax=Pseudoalteromonas sp. T1lg21 TaxID=2077095 RepID=UPI0018F89A72|nr:hypothetical protein [Pseudoalteromonas sp. T1lg21]
MYLYIWHSFVVIIFLAISFLYKGSVRFSDLQPIISALQNSAAMIFTIMGIWIAYIYPQAMRKVIQPSSEAIFPTEDKKRVKLLVGVVILSALTLATLLIGVFIKPFIVKWSFYISYPSIFSFLSIFVISLLVYVQLFCIYSVIASNVNFITDLINKENGQKINDKLDRTKKNN